MPNCSVCRLPSDLRAEAENMAARNVPLRSIEARVAEAGFRAGKDAIARHVNNGHVGDKGEAETIALCTALRRLLPSVPEVAEALAADVYEQGQFELAGALRSHIKTGARAGVPHLAGLVPARALNDKETA